MAGGSWKVAYADFMTAMMAFFLLMWLISNVPEEKLADLRGYFESGGQQVGSSGSVISPDTAPPVESLSPQTLSPAAETSIEVTRYINNLLREHNLQDSVRVTPTEAGVLLRAQTGSMFGENQVDLNENGQLILETVAQTIRQFKLNLVVRGHADAQETGTRAYPSKWELSAMRAATVTRDLVERWQVSPRLLVSVFYGDSRPIVPDAKGLASPENRRVEFFFHRPEIAVHTDGY